MAELNIELKGPPEDLRAWQFETAAEMTVALDELEAGGFTGEAKKYQNQDPEELVWRLTVKVPGGMDQHVYLSPTIDPSRAIFLVFDQTPMAFTQAQFDASRYQIVES